MHLRPLTRRGRAVVGLAVAALAMPVAAVVTATGPAGAAPAPPAGFTLTWSDDFNGAAGSGMDTGLWKYDTGPGSSFGTGEIETMTSSTANVYHDGSGHLVLQALHSGTDPRAGWTSGRVETQAADVRRAARRRRPDGVRHPAAQRHHRQRRRLLAGVLDARLAAAHRGHLADARARSTSWRTSTAAARSSAPCTAA